MLVCASDAAIQDFFAVLSVGVCNAPPHREG